MRLTFLGTSGSEGYPAAFCDCVRCVLARSLGGKNIRRRSSLLVDDDLLLDFGPDVPAALQDLRLSLARLRYVLITHAHDDHFVPITLKYRHPRYGAADLPLLTVFGSPPSLARLSQLPTSPDEFHVVRRTAVAGEWLEAEPYRILPLAARHSSNLDPFLYVVSSSIISVLYATGTGAFPEATWRLLEGLRLNAVVFDATFWSPSSDPDHLSLEDVLSHTDQLRRMGAIDGRSTVLLTHLSHRSQPDHHSIETRLAGTGVSPAYDGLTIEVPAAD